LVLRHTFIFYAPGEQRGTRRHSNPGAGEGISREKSRSRSQAPCQAGRAPGPARRETSSFPYGLLYAMVRKKRFLTTLGGLQGTLPVRHHPCKARRRTGKRLPRGTAKMLTHRERESQESAFLPISSLSGTGGGNRPILPGFTRLSSRIRGNSR
jgi:hypothetical protein